MKKKLSVLLALVTLALPKLFSALAQADGTDLEWNDFLQIQYYDEVGYDIAVNSCGNTPCVTGATWAEDFPVTDGAYDTSHNYEGDVFITKFKSAGSELIYSTFLGGWDMDIAYRVAMDDSGNAYVTGETYSNNFPTTPGCFDDSFSRLSDCFIAKLNMTGTDLLYSTYLGGSRSDRGRGIDIDESGNAYVVGTTSSADFPTTPGSFDETFNGGSSSSNGTDIFIVKINPSGSGLEYGTFIGGSDDEWGLGIATLGQTGRVFITGHTKSLDFPTTVNSFDTTHNGDHDAFVTAVDAAGKFLVYSTFLGGPRSEGGTDIVVDRFGQAYVVGDSRSDSFPTTPDVFSTVHSGERDVVVFKLSPNGQQLLFSTFLGGKDFDYGQSIAIDARGSSYLTGYTYSDDFPVSEDAFDITYSGDGASFIAKISPSGRALFYSTFLEGSSKSYGIDIDQYGQAYMTGWTGTRDFPTTPGVFDTTYEGWGGDAFVTKLDDSGRSLVFSTFLGGSWIFTGTAEDASAQLPGTFTLHQNHPNPFNAGTEIRYQTPADGHVTLRIYNTLGQQVRTLMDTDQPAGEHTVHWKGRDARGQEVASGLYFCRLKAGDFSETIKMVMVR